MKNKELEKKKLRLKIFIGVLVLTFFAYLIFVRPLLQQAIGNL